MREIRWPKYQWCSLHNYNIGVDCPSCERASIANTNIEACIKAWQEAQAGEYIKQAVYNGYSLKSDKPPLLPLDEEKLLDILKEHLTLLYETYEQCERDYNSCAKTICSKFGTPPSKKVSVDDIARIACQKFYGCPIEELHKAKWDRLLELEILDDLAQSIVDHINGKEV